jgi:curved DNA-binding protein CbpA
LLNGMQDYYQILQVASAAEQEVIEAAYRRLAKKYHPDVDTSSGATSRMQTLNEAFTVLSSPAKRADYDRIRVWHAPSQHAELHEAVRRSRLAEEGAILQKMIADKERRRAATAQVKQQQAEEAANQEKARADEALRRAEAAREKQERAEEAVLRLKAMAEEARRQAEADRAIKEQAEEASRLASLQIESARRHVDVELRRRRDAEEALARMEASIQESRRVIEQEGQRVINRERERAIEAQQRAEEAKRSFEAAELELRAKADAEAARAIAAQVQRKFPSGAPMTPASEMVVHLRRLQDAFSEPPPHIESRAPTALIAAVMESRAPKALIAAVVVDEVLEEKRASSVRSLSTSGGKRTKSGVVARWLAFFPSLMDDLFTYGTVKGKGLEG